MQIYIVRHGETSANGEGYLQGWSNDLLNDNGRMLVEITGQGIKGTSFDCWISSPLSRPKETAEIILQESGNDTPIEFDNRIKEINIGTFERISIISDRKAIQFLNNPIIGYKYPDDEKYLRGNWKNSKLSKGSDEQRWWQDLSGINSWLCIKSFAGLSLYRPYWLLARAFSL